MYWLSTQKCWKSFRQYSITTHASSLGEVDYAIEGDDELEVVEEGPIAPIPKRARKVRYLPAYAASYRFWYKGRLVWLWRAKEENSSRWGSDKSTLILKYV